MRIETWEIMQNADLDEIELQLAFQCAPLITGLKVSNLFQIDSRHYKRLCEILDKINDCRPRRSVRICHRTKHLCGHAG